MHNIDFLFLHFSKQDQGYLFAPSLVCLCQAGATSWTSYRYRTMTNIPGLIIPESFMENISSLHPLPKKSVKKMIHLHIFTGPPPTHINLILSLIPKSRNFSP